MSMMESLSNIDQFSPWVFLSPPLHIFHSDHCQSSIHFLFVISMKQKENQSRNQSNIYINLKNIMHEWIEKWTLTDDMTTI